MEAFARRTVQCPVCFLINSSSMLCRPNGLPLTGRRARREVYSAIHHRARRSGSVARSAVVSSASRPAPLKSCLFIVTQGGASSSQRVRQVLPKRQTVLPDRHAESSTSNSSPSETVRPSNSCSSIARALCRRLIRLRFPSRGSVRKCSPWGALRRTPRRDAIGVGARSPT